MSTETNTETTTAIDPLEKVFNYVSNKKYYTVGDFEKFKQDFSTEEMQSKLFDTLKKDKSFTASKGDFLNYYFPIVEETEETTEETTEEPETKDKLKK